MTKDVLQFAVQNAGDGYNVALVTVTETGGSSPASAGQMMAVLADGRTAGTVGGGASEHKLIMRAIDALNAGETTFAFDFDHSEEGMVCGGSMKGFGNIIGGGNRLILFGGGHVAQKIAPLAFGTGFHVTVVEDRPELESFFENVQYITATPAEYTQKVEISPNTYIVICTRGHKTDDDALRFCLGKPYAYLGMIGSRRKVATLVNQLKKENIPEEEIQRFYTPIGLDIASGNPAEIAVSVVAEILLVKNNGTPRHKRDI